MAQGLIFVLNSLLFLQKEDSNKFLNIPFLTLVNPIIDTTAMLNCQGIM